MASGERILEELGGSGPQGKQEENDGAPTIPGPYDPHDWSAESLAYGSVEEDLNLNSLVIGLGLDEVTYEPELFPGVVYDIDEWDAPLLIFEDGTVGAPQASSEDEARKRIRSLVTDLEDLGLLSWSEEGHDIQVAFVGTSPSSPSEPSNERTSTDLTPADAPNFCPRCGHDLRSHDIASYCPACGQSMSEYRSG